MREHPQQHRGIKPSTHIECGLIIHNGELHNVGIHWLLRVEEEGRKKNGFKFSLWGKKSLLCFPVYPTTWEESLSCPIKQNTHKEAGVTAHAKTATPETPPYWLSQAVSWFYWEEREFLVPPPAHLSVWKVEQLSCKPVICDTHAVLQQEQAATLGWSISALLSPFCNTLQRLLKAAPRKAGQHYRLNCCWVRDQHFVYTTKSWKSLENINALNLAEESTQAPPIKTNANNVGNILD